MKITLQEEKFGCYLIMAEDGRDILIQTDFDFPGVARSFGWNGEDDDINNARKFLDDNIGEEAEDPGYFD